MKFALACLSCALSAGAAHAQSSVTLFGILDAGVRYTKSGDDSRTLLSSGGIATSRIGFRGVEDLGNGLKAGFWLESQVNADDGTINPSGKFWHRRSTVSLMGGFGEVRLGRDFSPVYRVSTAADPFGDNGLAAITGQFSQTSINGSGTFNTHTRLDNAISYFTPDHLSGFSALITAAPGEGTAGNKLIGGNVGYKAGALQLLGGYSQTEVAVDEVKNWALAVVYDLGGPKLMAGYSALKYAAAKERHANVGATVPAGPGLIKANYVYTQGSGGSFEAAGSPKDKSQKVALGYQYDLSKRTALYTNAAYVKNDGGARFFVNGAVQPAANRSSKGVDVGVRHAF